MAQSLPTPMNPVLFASLESDLILPEQYFPEPHPSWSGEMLLLWKVFADGIETFRKEVLAAKEGGEVFAETMEWICEEGDERVFSFESLCGTFSLDPVWVRSRLLAWRERHHDTTPMRRAA